MVLEAYHRHTTNVHVQVMLVVADEAIVHPGRHSHIHHRNRDDRAVAEGHNHPLGHQIVHVVQHIMGTVKEEDSNIIHRKVCSTSPFEQNSILKKKHKKHFAFL